eukprot:scaffold638_cov168-Amphora_coffeaeformis.AAC.39
MIRTLPHSVCLRLAWDRITRHFVNMDRVARALSFLMITAVWRADAFSSPTPPDGSQSMNTLYDRFRTVCPADTETIRLYSSSLIDNQDTDSDAIWAAVFRTSNNKPSVYVKDEFLQAMRAAVDPVETASSFQIDSNVQGSFEAPSSSSKQAPVAVACLRPSPDFEGCYVLDSMRCILKKENTDASCDGGSEHTEAISAAIDSLLVQYLAKAVQAERRFDRAIRTKATLVGGVLLEERGFEEVQTMQKDMVTHISSLDACMTKYAERAVDLDTKSPGARQRALSIVSYLGRLDREKDLKASRKAAEDSEEDDEIDPWAGMKQFL